MLLLDLSFFCLAILLYELLLKIINIILLKRKNHLVIYDRIRNYELVILMSITPREFYVVIEQDEDGYYVGEVPQLKACYSQGETIDELMLNIKEAIELCLEEENQTSSLEFVDVRKIVV